MPTSAGAGMTQAFSLGIIILFMKHPMPPNTEGFIFLR